MEFAPGASSIGVPWIFGSVRGYARLPRSKGVILSLPGIGWAGKFVLCGIIHLNFRNMEQKRSPYQQNLQLKKEFKRRGLDLSEVMEFTPLDLNLENRRLLYLLDFVARYQSCGSREAMEAEKGGFVFPPIYPMISPDSDWYRFEQWLQGKPVRKTLAEQLPEAKAFRNPENIPEEELETELERLEQAIDQAGFGIGLCTGIPPRLIYNFLFETLDEMFELDGPDGSGGWVLDGCSGYCPGCFQRPWCDSGVSSCWPEDETAGIMHLTDEVQAYVSASPRSLDILRELQAEEDARHARWKTENPDTANEEEDPENGRLN